MSSKTIRTYLVTMTAYNAEGDLVAMAEQAHRASTPSEAIRRNATHGCLFSLALDAEMKNGATLVKFDAREGDLAPLTSSTSSVEAAEVL